MEMPKRGNTREEFEDAYAYGPRSTRFARSNRLRIALADGASESAFSQYWAKLLADDYVAKPYVKPETMLRRAKSLALAWDKRVRRPDLPWYVAERIRVGAFSTLLGLDVRKRRFHWKAISLGDTCLFQIRNDQLRLAWPLKKKEDFSNSPILLSTNNDALENVSKKVLVSEGDVGSNDIFILATDALSAWFLDECENDRRPWQTLLGISPHEFEDWISSLRSNSRIRNDDVTCIICRFVEA